MSIFVDTYTSGDFAHGMTDAWRITSIRPGASVYNREVSLWRPDNRYPGAMFTRRHESGGLELSFDALRHGAKAKPPIIIPERNVDRFILHCLLVRPPQDTDNTLQDLPNYIDKPFT